MADQPPDSASWPTPSTEAAIVTRGLSKSFGDVEAVTDVDLAVPKGSVFGFLGPNGSGKTTTIRMLLGLISPTAGTWSLLGEEMPRRAGAILPRVGALVEGPAFYPWLSGRDNLKRFDAAGPDGQRATRNQRIDEALGRVGLEVAAGRKYKGYSLGMRQRLGLAMALTRPRDLLVLDEPTNGMDPQGTREIRSLIRRVAGEGTTVFVSSHLLSEIEQVCTHAAVMSAGRLVAQGSLAELTGKGVATLRADVSDPELAQHVLGPILGQLEVEGREIRAILPDGGIDAAACNRRLVEAGVEVSALAVIRPNLEDRFVELTGEGFDVRR